MGLTGGDRGRSAPARRPVLIGLFADLLAALLALPLVLPPARSFAGPARAEGLLLLALRGFDPVSYFLPDGPRPGSERFELTWGGRVWRFASGANRAAFRDAPEVYAPRFRGHDAAGVLDGRLVDADPAVFALIDGRLYLFRDAQRRARLAGEPGLARAAEAVWPSLRGLLSGP
ncbi:YHS domain-containing (seleno)protein [Methylobacterium sp. NEAU 140]|uniref:YHS domain-containing (seleno)protein n=1 Tax=Methylobacterium sp. NEAU 140 TaxID=3064945 RepID=UPI0027333F6F|nr:YHS domain-containing (seleno)protein [Methylobacterium sp. NEAU 140]MDP4021520.1 YHS domain-containing (seleno)protein [Methylobacterium sp. NEAU 140]